MSKLLIAVASLLFFGAAQAADSEVVEKPLVAQTLDGFNKEAGTIRAAMQPGGRYEFLKSDEKGRVDARLTSMQAILQSHAGESDLRPSDKISLVNAQEEVNAVLRHNDSNRLICERSAPMGTLIPTTTCHTLGQIELQRRDAQKSLSDLNLRNNAIRNPNAPGGG